MGEANIWNRPFKCRCDVKSQISMCMLKQLQPHKQMPKEADRKLEKEQAIQIWRTENKQTKNSF